MPEITEAHILECYEAYKTGRDCPYPLGMNPSSAKMTMTWLDCIFNDRRWNRSFGAMQCGIVLTRIEANFGREKAHQVAFSIERDIDLRSKTYGSPQNVHRQVIRRYLEE